MSRYADGDPVTAQAMPSHATPIAALNRPATTTAIRSDHGNGSRARVTKRYTRCSSSVSANASPLGRVSAIAAIAGSMIQ